MKISTNNKNRLYELMERVNKVSLNKNIISNKKLLKEDILPEENKNQLIGDFIAFFMKKFDLKDEDLPNIIIDFKSDDAKNKKSFAHFEYDDRNEPDGNNVYVIAKNRNLADTLRSLAHELTHSVQFLENRLKDGSGKTGSDIENEANANAGVLMRDFGQQHPEIFE